MSQAFYRVWRPALWDEVVGQDHIVQTLQNAIATDRVAHAYLFRWTQRHREDHQRAPIGKSSQLS